MRKIFMIMIVIVCIAFILSACSNEIVQTVEVTRIIPQTVVVTATPEPAAITAEIQYPDDNSAYFDGILTITQYYKLLDQGKYREAYQLLSKSARQHVPDLDEYIESKTLAFKSVKIVTIQPFDEYVKQQGGENWQDFENNNEFYVQLIAFGEGPMSGAAISGEIQTLFITVVQEDGVWKIDSWSTS